MSVNVGLCKGIIEMSHIFVLIVCEDNYIVPLQDPSSAVYVIANVSPDQNLFSFSISFVFFLGFLYKMLKVVSR